MTLPDEHASIPTGIRALCLCCGRVARLDKPAPCCPNCGCVHHVPASVEDDDLLTVTISKQELRILCFWAANWAGVTSRTASGTPDHSLRAMETIRNRLGLQTDIPLSLADEIKAARIAFPNATIMLFGQDGLTNVDDDDEKE